MTEDSNSGIISYDEVYCVSMIRLYFRDFFNMVTEIIGIICIKAQSAFITNNFVNQLILCVGAITIIVVITILLTLLARATLKLITKATKLVLKMISSIIRWADGKIAARYERSRERKNSMTTTVYDRCLAILEALQTDKECWLFNHPVDPVLLKLPDYFEKIKNPMDLGTIHTKLVNQGYDQFSDDQIFEEFKSDVNLTFNNAKKYNPKSSIAHSSAVKLQWRFDSFVMNMPASMFNHPTIIAKKNAKIYRNNKVMVELISDLLNDLQGLDREVSAIKSKIKDMEKNLS